MDSSNPLSELVNRETGAARQVVSKYLYLALRRWWLIVALVGLVIGIEAYRLSEEPPEYASVARLRIGGKMALPQNNLYQEQTVNFFGTQILMIESPDVRKRALASLKAMHPELAKADHSATVRAMLIPDTTVFKVRAQGDHPEYTRLFLDAIIEAYFDMRQQRRSETSQTTHSAITAELAKLERLINNDTDAIQQFRAAHNIVFVREQASNAASQLVSLKNQMSSLKRERRLIEMYLDRANQKADQSTLDHNLLVIDQKLGGNNGNLSGFRETKKEIQFIQAERARLSRVFKVQHPQMANLARKEQQLQTGLEVFRKQSRQAVQQHYESLKLEIRNLQEVIDRWGERSLELSKRLGEYERLQKSLQRKEGLYDELLGSLRRIDTGSSLGQELVSILDEPSEATEVSKHEVRRLLQSAGIGLALGFLGIFLIEKWDEKIYHAEDIPKDYNLPDLGEVPHLSRRSVQHLLHPQDDRFSFVESIRSIRSYLNYHIATQTATHDGPAPRFFAISSAVPGEGKSIVSANLAIALAQGGTNTLLIDADLRKGTQHRLFQLENEFGLVDVLGGGCDWEDIVQPSDRANLDVLSRGSTRKFQAEMLNEPACERFFHEVNQAYDLIILDSSPLLATDDLIALRNYLDGLIVVARSGFSSRQSLRNAVTLVHRRDIPLVGYVLNSCRKSQSRYYKYSYYGA